LPWAWEAGPEPELFSGRIREVRDVAEYLTGSDGSPYIYNHIDSIVAGAQAILQSKDHGVQGIEGVTFGVGAGSCVGGAVDYPGVGRTREVRLGFIGKAEGGRTCEGSIHVMIVRRAIDMGINLWYGVGFYDGGVSGPRHIGGNAVGVTAPSQFYNHGMRAGLIESSDEGRAIGTRYEVAIDIPIMSDVGVVDAGREGISGNESTEAHSPLPGGNRGGW
jgi:hypothetical protein